MKRISVALALAVMVTLAVAGVAAAQDPAADPGGDGNYYYPGNGGNNSYSSQGQGLYCSSDLCCRQWPGRIEAK